MTAVVRCAQLPHQGAFSCELIEVPSGKLLTTVREGCSSLHDYGKSKDGATWVFWRQVDPFRLNIAERSVQSLALSENERETVNSTRWSGVSPDGHYCLMQSEGQSPETRVWDLQSKMRRGQIVGKANSLGFSADCKSLAVLQIRGTPRLAVIDVETMKQQAMVEIPELDGNGVSCGPAGLSDDGTYVTISTYFNGSAVMPLQTFCWNTTSGNLQSLPGLWDPQVIAGTLVGRSARTGALEFLDPDTGTLRLSVNHCEFHDVSPDHRSLIGAISESDEGFLLSLLRRIGITWSRRSDDKLVWRLFDPVTAADLGEICNSPWQSVRSFEKHFQWSPDGKTLAVRDSRDKSAWQLWDIPPRKPLTWFATGAVLLALPFALIARRYVRRLGVA
jgi:hypothetical protein